MSKDRSTTTRRSFLGAATVGTLGLAAAGPALAQVASAPAPQVDFPASPREFGGGAAQADDVTIVLIRRLTHPSP